MVRGWEYLALTPERIYAVRRGLGLSQPQFAAFLGATGKVPAPSLSAVSRWERGERRPGKVYGPLIVKLEQEGAAQWQRSTNASSRSA